jgi:hypothetical protein
MYDCLRANNALCATVCVLTTLYARCERLFRMWICNLLRLISANERFATNCQNPGTAAVKIMNIRAPCGNPHSNLDESVTHPHTYSFKINDHIALSYALRSSKGLFLLKTFKSSYACFILAQIILIAMITLKLFREK